MGTIATADLDIRVMEFGGGVTGLHITTPATADNGDDFSITLANYGIRTMLTASSWYHSTENSVIVSIDLASTAVATGVATFTLDSTAGTDKKRVVVITGDSKTA